jgi:hypothetical protein
MKPIDLFLYLLGHRGAIERIATSRRALWAGALLVISAGIARNYDHLFLLRQPEWIYGPFGMSLLSAVLIWFMLMVGIYFKPDGGGGRTFRTFLTLFWLTAPCAWLYGIPVERFTDLLGATQWNFAFLIVVAVWRIALIVRAVVVLTGAGVGRVLAFVLFPACAEMLVGSFFKTLSLVGIMGGVRLPPHHEFLKKASGFVMTGSFWLGIACLLAMVICSITRHRRAAGSLCRDPKPESRGLIPAAWTALMVWGLTAIPVQVQVSRNYQLSQFFEAGQWREGIKYAAARERADFLPHHFFPPDPFGHGSFYLPLLEAMDGSEPEWLRKEWISQAILMFDREWVRDQSDPKVIEVLSRYPEIWLEREALPSG